MDYLYFLIRISVCFILGIIIGIERQCRRKIAGVRTITLVSLGAFLFVSISELTANNDITRIAAQVVSGMGFLGAGIIVRDGTNVRGLNTAATVWCSAAIGTLTALGLIVEATIGVVYILLSNLFLRFIARKMMMHNSLKGRALYLLKIVCDPKNEMDVRNTLIQKFKSNHNKLKAISTSKIEEQIKIEARIDVFDNSTDGIDSIVNRLCVENGVISVEYDKIMNYLDDDDEEFDTK